MAIVNLESSLRAAIAFAYASVACHARAEVMRAMAADSGDLELAEIAKPTPGKGEVRVVAASVNAGEEKVISGDFVGRFLHAKTKPLIVGWDFAGTVDALGEGVTDLEEGAPVRGHLQFTNRQKQGRIRSS